MIKIGILGSENTHALHFAKYINLPDSEGKFAHEDIRITHIFGFDFEQAKKVAQEANIENVVEDYKSMLGEVDAAMILFRDGKYHYQYALPFVERGLPVWVDKPFTVNPLEALSLIKLAEGKKVALSGGSCCKWVADIAKLKEKVTSGEIKPISATMNFAIYIDSEHSGIHFYAPHLVEMVAEVFGYNVLSVYAARKNADLTAIFEYENINVLLVFTPAARKYSCYIIEQDQNTLYNIEMADLSKAGMEDFITAIKTGTPKNPPINLYYCTVIVNAIEQSMKTGERVLVKY